MLLPLLLLLLLTQQLLAMHDECTELWKLKMSSYERRVQLRKQAEAVRPMNSKAIWDPWEPEWNCDIEERVGEPNWGDGPKFMCNPHCTLAEPDCLVYSFGSNGKIQFERGVKAINPDCEVHVFDPTDPPSKSSVVSAVGTFHQWGLGDVEKKFSLGKVMPLASIMELLGHTGRRLTVLKVDVEGAEWNSFKNHIWELCRSGQLSIGQIQIELHMKGSDRSNPKSFFDGADSCGFMIFHKERNGWGCAGFRCLEYALIHKDTALTAFVDSHCPSSARSVVTAVNGGLLHSHTHHH